MPGPIIWEDTASGPGLWTVGYYQPNGGWFPDSDHDSPTAAHDRANLLNGDAEHPMVYLRSEPGLWTTGWYDTDGGWLPDRDWTSEGAAAQRVIGSNA